MARARAAGGTSTDGRTVLAQLGMTGQSCTWTDGSTVPTPLITFKLWCIRTVLRCEPFPILQASDAEPTLGDRVAALQLEEEQRAAGDAGEAAPKGVDGDAADAPMKAIKADSLAVLLTQVSCLFLVDKYR